MATASENALIAELISEVRGMRGDLGEVKTNTAVTAQAVARQDRTLDDHEERIRTGETLRETFVTKAAMWRFVTLAATLASGSTGVIVAKLLH